MPFFILFVIPMVVGALGFWLLSGVTWKEFTLQILAQAVVAGLDNGWDPDKGGTFDVGPFRSARLVKQYIEAFRLLGGETV